MTLNTFRSCQCLPKEGLLSAEQTEEIIMEEMLITSTNGLRFYLGESVAKCVKAQ